VPDHSATLAIRSAADLLVRLKTMEIKASSPNSLVLISLGGLPLQNAGKEFWEDFDVVLSKSHERYEASVYKLSNDDWGLLVKLNDFIQVRVIPDLKLELLRLIQRYFPENFGMIDQSRLIRMLDLTIRLPNAIRYLERLNERPEDSGGNENKLRRLHEDDIQQVKEISKQLGAQEFAKVFIHHQKIAIILPEQAPMEFMNEYFVAMGALKEHVFPKVELRGAGNLFNQLTVVLDGLLLNAFGELNTGNAKCSINMNVESVFSKDFERWLGASDDATFSNVVFEFRQSNILQSFEEFQLACDLIRSKNGTIAIDAIFPETIGIVSLGRLQANIAKIFWRAGAEEILPKYKKEIDDIQKSGTVLVLARLDDEVGVKVGQDLGISMFQGFYIDELLTL
jgi:hypothetical protein